MTEPVRFKNKRILYYVIASILFWAALFFITPHYIEFGDTYKYMNIRGVTLPDWALPPDIGHIKEIQKKQSIIHVVLMLYGLASLVLFYDERKWTNTRYFLSLLVASVIVLIVSSIYYRINFQPFETKLTNFRVYFMVIRALPFVLIAYYFFRRIFMAFTAKEPKLVGKIELFTDPVNWLFTMLVFFVGIIMGHFSWLFI